MPRQSVVPVALYVALFALAIPWYWRFFPELAVRVILGFPLWVFSSIVFSAAISALTAWMLATAWWSDEDTTPDPPDSSVKDRP